MSEQSGNVTEVRPARPDDLDAIWRVRYLTDVVEHPNPPPRGERPPFFAHLLETGYLLVAATGAGIAGYAGSIERGGIVYLTDLFVDPTLQSKGIGQLLLQQVLPEGIPRCTLSSADFRAVSLYTRFGMAPRWPNLLLEAETAAVSTMPGHGISVTEGDLADPEFGRWDTEICGRPRALDIDYWRRNGARLLWLSHDGERVGYAMVKLVPAGFWQPACVRVGPVGVRRAEDAMRALHAAVKWSLPLSPWLSLTVPGPHPGLPGLLEAGLKVKYVETYCASVESLVDPARYVGSDGELF